MNKLTAKSITLIVAIAVVVTALIGGTVAWIMTETKPVVNTFTYGDINIDLDETDATWNDQEDQFEKEFEMIPGNDLVKDPTVTVKADSEACWLFVKLDKAGGDVTLADGTVCDFDSYLEYTMADGWTQLKDGQGNDIVGVFYREVAEIPAIADGGQDLKLGVIADNKVKVKQTVTKEMFNALDVPGGENKIPTLTITAYAVQKDNIDTALEAWTYADAEFNQTQTNP